MNARVLVLNASFEPINVCTERRAVVMIFKGVARMEEHNGHMLHSQKIELHAPSVIRLTEYRHIPFERRSLSRKNILMRDHSCCQYCGQQFAPSELTLDHVVPRSRGGQSTWDNLVASCKVCNGKKRNRLLKEVNMRLLRQPRPLSQEYAGFFLLRYPKLREAYEEFLMSAHSGSSRLHGLSA